MHNTNRSMLMLILLTGCQHIPSSPEPAVPCAEGECVSAACDEGAIRGTEWIVRELAATSQRAAELEYENQTLLSERDQLTRRVTELESERQVQQVSLQRAHGEIRSTQADLQQATHDLRIWRDELARLRGELQRTESSHVAELDALSTRINRLSTTPQSISEPASGYGGSTQWRDARQP